METTAILSVKDMTTTAVVNSTLLPFERPFDDIGIIVSASILFTLMVLGAFGNSFTIAVIAFYNELRTNVFLVLILSLSVSDLTSSLISWLFLYRRTWGFDVWEPIPQIFCKFYWAADIMTSFATANHIFAFAVVRHLSINYPILFQKLTIVKTQILIGCLWLVSFLTGFVPMWIFTGARARDRNGPTPDARWPACTTYNSDELYYGYTIYNKVGFPLFLYLPGVGVIVTSALIIHTVLQRAKFPVSAKSSFDMKKRRRQREKERQAIMQLLLIAALFLFGYLPFTVYEFWSNNSWPNTRYYKLMDYWMGMIQYFFLRISECLNPVIYNLGSNKMRSYTKKFISEEILRRPRSDLRRSSRFSTINAGVSSSRQDSVAVTSA